MKYHKYEDEREPKIHKVQKGMGSRIDKHKKLIYNLASAYKKPGALDELEEANLYYDSFPKRK